jgi:glycosyltransferase involved in cell wall biosynthesis
MPRQTPVRSSVRSEESEDTSRTFGILSTFPPTSCGIATFSAALASGLLAGGHTVDVVRCGSTPYLEDPLVLAALGNGSPNRIAAAIDVLNSTDAAIIQHEYGLYDGLDGEAVLEIMAGVEVPMIVVAHTVISDPTAHQRLVLEQVCDAAEIVVVMTATGRTRLLDGFDVAPSKVVLIPHGATTLPDDGAWGPRRQPGEGQRLLTWGLLGPGKGIEWAIDAVAELADIRPRPTYVIAGATHPKVHARSGESYRQMLATRAATSVAHGSVVFDDEYRDLSSLMELIRSADLVVLPYDSKDQVTSGVLVDAVAAGRPVVSTAFPHAVELLGSGAGIVVPQRDPKALAGAIRAVITDPDRAASMAAEARRLAPELSWSAVAGAYAKVAGRLIAARSSSMT